MAYLTVQPFIKMSGNWLVLETDMRFRSDGSQKNW